MFPIKFIFLNVVLIFVMILQAFDKGIFILAFLSWKSKNIHEKLRLDKEWI